MRNFYFLISAFLLFVISACTSNPQSHSESDPLLQKAHEIAQKTIITDGHIDVPYRLNEQYIRDSANIDDVSRSTEGGDFDYPRAKSGGLDAPFMSIYVPSQYQRLGGAKKFADRMINIVEGMVSNAPDKFQIATSPADVLANFEKGIISLPMGMENGAPIEESLRNIAYFHERGIRYITLTHGKDNQICDSSYDTTYTWNGLSPFGERVISEMNRVGIMVDISHVSDSTFYDVLKLTKAPVIASHSSCRVFTPGFQRNMNDDMIGMLKENGGVIQINFGSSFLDSTFNRQYDEASAHLTAWLVENKLSEYDEKAIAYRKQYYAQHLDYPDVSLVADHIDHVVKIAGIDHVAFGSDYDGVGDSLPIGLKDVSEYPNLIRELLERGYSEEDIQKICYKNVFRVWEAVEEIAKELQFDEI